MSRYRDVLYHLLILDFEGTCQDISSVMANRQAHTSILQVYLDQGRERAVRGPNASLSHIYKLR